MEEKLLRIIGKYGINNQIRKFNEEAFELEEAIITHELKKSVEYEIPLTEIIGTKEHITEELADVCVMLHQFSLIIVQYNMNKSWRIS
jgi:NTP pyrophosphatase (non-canonical NTP hydrolase)